MNSIIESINNVADTYSAWLLHGAWQGAIVALGVLALLKVAPRIPLSIQYALLLLALVKFITPPLLTMPSGLFSMVNVATEDLTAISAAYHNTQEHTARPAIVSEGESTDLIPPENDSQRATPTSTDLADLPISIVAAQRPIISPASIIQPKLSWWGVLLLFHISISALFAAWIVLQMVRLSRMIAGSRCIQWARLNVSLPSSLVRGISLRHSDHVSGPMAFGVLKPSILVPSALLTSDSKTLESVLLHEIAHIRRKDLWVRWLEIAVQSIWWLNPLVWVVARKLSSVREDICDDFAISNSRTSEDQYCQTLINVAAQSPRPLGSLLACGIMDAHPLARRIKRLMNGERLRARPLSIMALTLVLIAAIVLLPGVRSQRLAQAQTPETAPEAVKQDQTLTSSQNPSPINISKDGLKLKARMGRLELHRTNVRGVVQNESGEPVAGATVIVGCARGETMTGTDDLGNKYSFKGELARTTSDREGRYEFKDLTVPCTKVPLNAKLQIVAVADDYGLTWSNVIRYLPDVEVNSEASKAKPNIGENEDWERVFFHGQDIDIPVTIVKGVALHGKVVDAKGSPIPDVVVRLGRVLMPEDGIDSEPRNTIFRFLDSPLKELGFAPCDIIPLEFRQTKTDTKGHYQLLNVPMKARAGVSFSHPRFPANELFDISTSSDPNAKHDIASGQPLDVTVKTVTELHLSVTDGTGPKLPGSRFEIVESFNNTSTQHSSIATADASGTAKMRLTEGRYSIRISPPSDKKLWSSIFPIDVRYDSKPHEISFVANSPQPIRIKATSLQDGKGIKDIAFEFCREGLNPVWLPVTTQGVTSEYVRTDHTGILDALFSISVMRIRVAGEATRAMLRDKEPILISSPHTSEIEFVFANRPESTSGFDPRSAKIGRGRYRYRTNNHLKKSNATLPQIEELVASMRTARPSEALNQLQNFFDDHGLADQTIIQDGPRRIVTSSVKNDSSVSIADGLHHIEFEPFNRQCDVCFSKDSRTFIPSVGSLLITPFKANNDKDQNSGPTPAVQEANDFVRIIRDSDFTLKEVSTPDQKFVVEQRVVRDKTSEGKWQNTEVEWQLFPKEIQGLMFPSMCFKATFRDDVLHQGEIVLFDEIEFLESVPGDTFAMSVPAGTLLIDHRFTPEKSSSPNIRALKFATFDVAAILKPLSTWSLLDPKINP